MKIDIRFRNLQASDSLREHAARRVHFHLSRFGEAISSVCIRIGDVNGPKGGLDKQCRVTLRGPSLSSVVIEELREDTFLAVEVAVERASRAVGRDLDRQRSARAASWAARKAS
jgi:putative sigma-54 modulation protein